MIVPDPDAVYPPGAMLNAMLRAQGMTQAALADKLGRPHQVISEIVNARKRITGRTALGLEAVFGINAEYWMYAQAEWDLSVARQRLRSGIVVKGRATR